MKFKIDTQTPPPAARSKFTAIPEFLEALTTMPVGARIPVKTAEVDQKTVRAHVGKVTRENEGYAFIVRTDAEAGETSIWRVAKEAAEGAAS